MRKIFFWKKAPKPTDSAYRTAPWKRFLISIAVLGTIASVAFFSAGPFLHRNDTLDVSATTAVVLMGDLVPRANLAISLFSQKQIKRILYFRPENNSLSKAGIVENEGDLTLTYLHRKGIPSSAIEYVSSTSNSSTREEALAITAWLNRQDPKPKHIVICTSWYHSRRAGWVIEQVLKGTGIQVSVVGAISKESDPGHWWKTERGVLDVFTEYLKWGYYLLNRP